MTHDAIAKRKKNWSDKKISSLPWYIKALSLSLQVYINEETFFKSWRLFSTPKSALPCANFDHVRIKNLAKKCLLNVYFTICQMPRLLRGGASTFTDGSDMYIQLKLLYIAVMLGIVQKRINHANDVHHFSR